MPQGCKTQNAGFPMLLPIGINVSRLGSPTLPMLAGKRDDPKPSRKGQAIALLLLQGRLSARSPRRLDAAVDESRC
jgi:hypothetical protein